MAEPVEIAKVIVTDRMRELDEAAVSSLMESIGKMGLMTPISVRPSGGEYELVAGAHRLEAMKRLGERHINSVVLYGWAEKQARKWHISENLHRADLTALQRAEWIAEWIRITDEEERVSLQVATKPQGGRPEAGVRRAARELNVESTAAHRAIKIDGLSREAKKVAAQVGLEKNQRALVAASRADTPEDQVNVLRTWHEQERPKVLRLPPAVTKDDPPDMYVVARMLASKYSILELTQLIDHLGDIIKEREVA